MSEFFTGITFPQQKVTPSYDAVVRRAVLADGILSGCALSYTGSTLTMGAGVMVACGREFLHTSVQNWAVTGANSGYARLLLTIDTTRASTKDAFEQIVDSIEYATALDGFAPLQQDDINESGTVYQIVVCVVSLGSGGITGIMSRAGGNSVQVVLPASGWSNNRQTVSIPGVSSDHAILVAPQPEPAENFEAYNDAAVRAVSKAAGVVTFVCDSVPGQDLTVNVALRV